MEYSIRVNSGKDIAYDCIDDSIQLSNGISGLSVALAMGAAFCLTHIPHPNVLGAILFTLPFAVGGNTKSCAAMAAEHIAGQERLAFCVQRRRTVFFVLVGADRERLLNGLKSSIIDDSKMFLNRGAGFSASQNAGVHWIFQNALN